MIFQNIFEPVRKVDAPEELRPESELPPLEMPEPNFFDGMGDTWKAIPNAVLDTASSAITGLRQIPLENFTTQPEVREWVRRQREEVMPENARRIREIAKQEYELDPQTSGTAAQIVYGLGEMIPKAVLYGSVAGPAGGALLFGADVGVNRTQTLLDEGVDEQTAINAGMLTFAANAIGLKLPAAFATGSRLTSAAIGAGANVGLNVAEVQGVHWILENQNYDELAKNYELNFADNAVAAGLGAAFGAAFWRPTTRVRFEQERKALSERFATELERTGKFTPQQVTAQANLNASVVTSAASRWGLTPEQVSSVAPRVRIAETTNQSDLNQIIGIEGAENLRESGADIDYIAVAESMRAQGKLRRKSDLQPDGNRVQTASGAMKSQTSNLRTVGIQQCAMRGLASIQNTLRDKKTSRTIVNSWRLKSGLLRKNETSLSRVICQRLLTLRSSSLHTLN